MRAGRPRGVPPPKFVTGSIMRHILVMTSTGAIGLMAIFTGDLANIYFLSQLGDLEIVAAVGYASSILFFATSIGIGLAIAAVATISPEIGAGQRVRARRLSASAHMLTAIVSLTLSLILWLIAPWLLRLVGATGRTHALASQYLSILIPFLTPLALGMTSGAVLRSAGDPRRSMHVTLFGALVNIALDPILIFVLGLGLKGAAWATAISRLVVVGIGLYGVVRVHHLMAWPKLRYLEEDAPRIMRTALPAVLTNVATPAANAYVTTVMATFGDGAVAGWTYIGRVIPVAFGIVFALSGSVGPILGQNYGAHRYDRMRRTLTDSLVVTAFFTFGAWAALALLADPMVGVFKATGEGAALILLFCRWLSPLFFFLGALFIANAAFNTLGRPHYATALNWGRATLGTVPFVKLGAWLVGAHGVLAGSMIGTIAFGVIGVWLSFRLVEHLSARPRGDGEAD